MLGVNIASIIVGSPLVTYNPNTQHCTALCRIQFGSYRERIMVLSRWRVESLLLAIPALHAMLCSLVCKSLERYIHIKKCRSADDVGVCGGGPGIQHIDDPPSKENEDLISIMSRLLGAQRGGNVSLIMYQSF